VPGATGCASGGVGWRWCGDDPSHACSAYEDPAQDQHSPWRMGQTGDLNHNGIGDDVLDIGCGTGTFATLLKQLYPAVEVIGLDQIRRHFYVRGGKQKEPECQFPINDSPMLERTKPILGCNDGTRFLGRSRARPGRRSLGQRCHGLESGHDRCSARQRSPDSGSFATLRCHLRLAQCFDSLHPDHWNGSLRPLVFAVFTNAH